MDENRVAGTARNLGGKVKEEFGRATSDSKSQFEGVVNQVKGTAQDLYGQARDSTSDLAGAARDSASTFERTLRNAIENQPYMAVAVALALGWLLGRTHRPL